MPYIDQSKRTMFHDFTDAFDFMHAETITPGELNYLITRMVHHVAKKRGLSYSTFNMLTGVLESVKSELYRQVIAPYEDKKRRENGGVSELDAITMEDVR